MSNNSMARAYGEHFNLSTEQIIDINNETYFNIKNHALKAKQAMELLGKNGFAIVDMFFPNCMYSFMIKEPSMDMVGMCDKIEIVDGRYYPVLIKSGKPPLKGVWQSDAIELVSHAILIEEEFESDVYVGFIDYEKIGDRRPVVMDVNMRKAFFDTVREVKEIIANEKMPVVKKSVKKCEKCEYNDICIPEE